MKGFGREAAGMVALIVLTYTLLFAAAAGIILGALKIAGVW